MDFLGIGPLELLFIIIIALIVIGPRDMARTARVAGRYLNRLYRSESWRMLTDASRTLRTLPQRLAREAALEELDETRQLVEETGDELKSHAKKLSEDLQSRGETMQHESPEADGAEGSTSPEPDITPGP